LSPHNEAQLKTHAPVGKSVTDFEVSNCGKTDCFPQCKATQLALRDISRRRNNSVAFGAKRTFNEPRFINPNKARGVKSAKIQTEILPQIQSFTSRLWLPMVL
jgi:hypothetical protein